MIKLSNKAKEEYAKSLLSFSTSMYTSLFSIFVIIPVILILKVSFTNSGATVEISEAFGAISLSNYILLNSLICFGWLVGFIAKYRAIQLLNQLPE
jgi:uncharacterized membrane protein YeiB